MDGLLLFKLEKQNSYSFEGQSLQFSPEIIHFERGNKEEDLNSMKEQQYVDLSSHSDSSSLRSNGDDREIGAKFPLTFWETAGAFGVILSFAIVLVGIYLSLPDSDYSFLKFPRSLEDLRVLRYNLDRYTTDYTIQVLVGYCVVYIFMLTFMIPGTVFMSLLAGSLFGVLKGVALVVFAATVGASCCYFLSNSIGRPLILSLWPDKLVFFQDQVAKRKSRLLNYMLFLRVTPTFPSAFINVASPLVNVPYHTFAIATSLGIVPIAFVTVRAGMALGELQSIGDLYDVQSLGALFFIGIASITPTLISNKSKS